MRVVLIDDDTKTGRNVWFPSLVNRFLLDLRFGLIACSQFLNYLVNIIQHGLYKKE
jgi:hypothetical protein